MEEGRRVAVEETGPRQRRKFIPVRGRGRRSSAWSGRRTRRRPWCGVFIRAPWAERVGENAEALAAERTGKTVAVRQGPALATAFHPS